MRTMIRIQTIYIVFVLLLHACISNRPTPETMDSALNSTKTPPAATKTKSPSPTANVPVPTSTVTATATPAFTTITLSVPGSACWIDSGVEFSAGDSVFLSATGMVNTWEGKVGSNSDPDGQYKKVCGGVKCPLQGADYGALIGRLGEGETFLVGTHRELSVSEAGKLYLTVNDWECTDNSGEYALVINYGKELIASPTPEHQGSWNLALNQPVDASRGEAERPPKYAMDGDAATDWGSGGPPRQWIEIDLGAPARVERIRLLVTQHPSGDTVHSILIRAADGEFAEIHRFEQSTSTGDWLEFVPEEPLEGIQWVRIETLKSPSWVGWIEIEVIGET